jgi:hypothetical protein
MTAFVYTSICVAHPELNGKRYADSYTCPACKTEAAAARRKASPEKHREYHTNRRLSRGAVPGALCPKHPEYGGKRRSNGTCVRCHNERQTKKALIKRTTSELHNAKHRICNLIFSSFKRRGFSKNSRTAAILGCSWEEFKAHMENKFVFGMSWDNSGKWHIDHVVPLATATSVDEVAKLCHYTNLQPLWAEDNIIKSDRVF